MSEHEFKVYDQVEWCLDGRFDLYVHSDDPSVHDFGEVTSIIGGVIWCKWESCEEELQTIPENIRKAQPKTQQTDPHIEAIRQMLLERSNTGISKYGTTLARNDLKPSQWAQHLLEELLDAAGYVHRLKEDLEQIENIGRGEK